MGYSDLSVGYNNVKEVVKVGGTNTASPPSMTVVPGVSSNFCLTTGEVLASGAAKSLIVCDSNGVELDVIQESGFLTDPSNAPVGTPAVLL